MRPAISNMSSSLPTDRPPSIWRCASCSLQQRARPTDKKLIISRQNAYHGSTYLTAACCGKPRDKGFVDEASHLVRRISSPYPYRRPAGMSVEAFCDFLVEELERTILELGPNRVACFVAEPILASGGVIVPPEGYHRRK